MRFKLALDKKTRSQLALVCIALLCIGAYLWYMPKPKTPVELPTASLYIGNTKIEVELAATQKDREQGLSGRSGLGVGQGMFFVFDEPGNWSFWMKDMHFAIDILWIDENGTIVAMERSLEPSTYPRSYSPGIASRYVLEVPAGFTKAEGIAVGQKIVVQY